MHNQSHTAPFHTEQGTANTSNIKMVMKTIASKKPLTALLFLLSIAAADARLVSHTSAKATPTPEAVCLTAKYPTLCRELVDTYHPASVQSLMESAFRETIVKLKEAKAKSEALNRQLGNGTSDGRNTFSCAAAYDSTAYTLEQQNVLGAIAAGHSADVVAYGSGVSGSISICYDIFDVDGAFGGKMVFPGSPIYYNLQKHATDLMTVVCAAYPGHCS